MFEFKGISFEAHINNKFHFCGVTFERHNNNMFRMYGMSMEEFKKVQAGNALFMFGGM